MFFEGVNFIKVEIAKIKSGDNADGEAISLIEKLKEFLAELKLGQQPSENKQISKDTTSTGQSIISVNVDKLDRLMDLVGEMV